MERRHDMTDSRAFIRFASRHLAVAVLLCAATSVGALAAPPDHAAKKAPQAPSLSCDHGYVQWQIPKSKERKLPILMWHSSASKNWEHPTPAGGEGFNHIFLRRGYPVYIIDGPTAGRAGQACDPYDYTPDPDSDQSINRLGIWIPPAPPEFFPGVQFPVNDPAAMNQYRRAGYIGEPQTHENIQAGSEAAAALLEEIGPTVLFTHSGSGIRGWWTRIKSDKVKAIVAFESGSFVFPEGEVPPPLLRADGELQTALGTGSPGSEIPLADFLKLTTIPIRIVIGDFIARELDPINVGPRLFLDTNRLRVIRSKLFAEAINRHGGNAEVFILPEHGIFGNTHFMMWELNNQQIAATLSDWLSQHGLDRLDDGDHKGRHDRKHDDDDHKGRGGKHADDDKRGHGGKHADDDKGRHGR
jgi:hypothetical protein